MSRWAKIGGGAVWLGLFAAVFALLPLSPTASALTLRNNVGYFHQHDYTAYLDSCTTCAEDVSPGTFTDGDTSKAHFISDVEGSRAKAFYIDVMLNKPYGSGDPSAADVTTWENAVNNDNIGIKYASWETTENSLYVAPGHDGQSSGDFVFHSHDTDGATALILYNTDTGTEYTKIKVDCGNIVDHIPIPLNSPPTGTVTVSCNANGTGKVEFSFSDPDGATTATLSIAKAGGGTDNRGSYNNGSHTVNNVAATEVDGSWSATIQVADKGGTGTKSFSDNGTNCNKLPTGSIGAVNCKTVSIKLRDPNTPTSNIKYYVSVNGGAKYGPTTVAGDTSTNKNVSGAAGFNWWGSNAVDLYGVDVQTGATTGVLASTTLTAVCGTIACSSSTITPAHPVAGVPITVRVAVTIGGGAPNGPPGAKFTSIKLDTLNTSSDYTQNGTGLYSGTVTYSPPDAGSFTLTWVFGGGSSNPPSVTCTTSNVQVGLAPYFTVEGGDFAAGPGFGDSCTTNTSADVTAYNLNNLVAGHGYYGAGSQLATLANGTITQFATDSTLSPGDGTSYSTNGLSGGNQAPPSALALAATTANPASYNYGGGLAHTSGWCVRDYYAAAAGKAVAGTPDYAIRGERTYKLPANSTLGNITIQPGVHVTLVAQGNVYINGPITYAGYTNLDDIPYFALLIKGGNLYVNNTVTNLTGWYDVQPNGAAGGTLATCASGLGSVYSADYDACNHPLTVYGAVSAARLNLGRTSGNLVKVNGTDNNAAERFVYSPELWLGHLTNPCAVNQAATNCLYQSYTELPPVL